MMAKKAAKAKKTVKKTTKATEKWNGNNFSWALKHMEQGSNYGVTRKKWKDQGLIKVMRIVRKEINGEALDCITFKNSAYNKGEEMMINGVSTESVLANDWEMVI